MVKTKYDLNEIDPGQLVGIGQLGKLVRIGHLGIGLSRLVPQKRALVEVAWIGTKKKGLGRG